MASTRIADHIGRVLGGRYRLSAAIGTGASAHVFLAEDTRLHRRVAIKVLHPALADDAAFLRRFQAEARAAAALSHPNVLAVYDWGEEEDGPFIVTEFLGGGSLRAMLDRGHRLTQSQALLVGLEAARGLDYAHRRGLVHRDIKPGNLLFDDDGHLRIADFGLARALAEAAWTEPSGAVLGTARYAAPEQVRGIALDGRSDVYSLALVLVEAVTGRVPFAADTTVGTILSRLERPLEVPDELGPLAPILARAGLPDPEARPDAMAVGAAFHQLAGTLPSPEPLPVAGHAMFDDTIAVLDRDPTEMGWKQEGSVAVVPPPAGTSGSAPSGDGTAVIPVKDKRRRKDKAKGAAAAPVAPPAPPPMKEGKPRGRRKWPWVVLATLVALVASTLAGIALVQAQVPSHPVTGVTDQPVETAKAELTRLGFHAAVDEQFVDDKPAGVVVSQSPAAGVKLKEGRTVRLVVSKGPPPVDAPDLTDKTYDEAVAAIEGVGLKIGEATGRYDEEAPATQVLDWEPKSGTRKGDIINVTVSKGPSPRTIPDLTAKTYDQAVAALQNLGLSPIRDERYDDDVAEGKIIGSRPPVGFQVDRGSTVTIVISKGQPAVPNLIGKTEAEAKAALEAVDLKLGNVFGPPGGHVFLSTPNSGSKVKRSSTVSIYIL
ncbi:MAG: PASTA domain-containing protein [Acidimicrobiales bacterium]